MSERHLDRMRRAALEAATLGHDAMVIGPSPDLVYLTGHDPMPLERATLLVLRAGRDPVLVVPELERALAARAPAGADLELVGWVDGVDPYALVASMLDGAGTVAAGDRLWASHVLALQAAAPGVRLVPASAVMVRLRGIKDADELDALRRAGAAADHTFEAIVTTPFAGRRERDIAADLADLLVEHGHQSAAFTIVASGPNSASPHHEPGERVMVEGDLVVLDFGGMLDDYHSDTTRTVAVGQPSARARDVHEVVLRAQQAGSAAVRPGVPIQEVDRTARAVITDAGYGERFIHRTGHGIGLEVHEPPYAIEGDTTVLEPGMTFSVEPGIYLEGELGVRIEDIVVVTAGGVEYLNTTTRDLVLVE